MKGILLSVLAFGVSWTGAVWYWRSTNRMPDTGDLAACLVALPLSLLLGYWLVRKGASAWSARAAEPAAPAAGGAGAAAAGAAATAAADGAAAPASLAIAAAALHAPHGDSAAALAGALADNKARPDLDKELYDDDGYPVMCARAEGVDEQNTEQEISEWLAAQGQPALYARDEFWRAMALATPAVLHLAEAAAAHPRVSEAATAADNALAGHGTAAQAARALNAVPTLQLIALLPPEWNSQWRDVAGRWLSHHIEQAGWPQQRIAVNTRPGQHPGPVLAALQQSGEPCVAVLLACTSHLGDATVDAWSSNGSLFTAARPQGAMPGEAAAGLLLLDAEQAALLHDGPYPMLAPVAAGQRPNDVAQARNGDCAVLKELAQQAMQPLADSAEVPLIVADTGHRSTRLMEMMAAAQAVQPKLDPAQDILALGNATGQAGNAGFLAALALARHEVQERGAPVLCIANEDPYLRCAALIRPASDDMDNATSATPA
ncbi:hypothetical protein ASD15_11605 [Massilia sp. Root351]|jgi:hypothetical protein|uniref:hypothetical protein n=1 Tax=Massilia sp. Root351 TaxID=1736522 RepID=UPI00070C74A5|nr:hypothetical protein [Massilia sp. Root351]KQV80588.1 hypothetical protein ASD15_11605 [Massilia sp. Root351]